MEYNRHSFFKSTFCIFKAEKSPNRKPDYASNSGSLYWFDENGVFRESNHWGRAAKCKWRLVESDGKTSRTRSGYAKWADFFPDNEVENLYFLKFQNGQVQFFHKSAPEYAGEHCRTSAETMKRIRKIRQYIQQGDSSEIFLKQLADTDLPVHEINRLLSHS
ncbi:hypothetical protein [Flavobacterium sp.]|uniref:hypothetical protein n=1 Tax=Flavobacterium sp. TaxID=239 RepID=UPI001202E81B|nr:hypothetical protein [Flavobacterium sp.]RZJ72700.1 MAG: hypothetical protein EOO49_03425 [Flavobacterium sp.]